MNNRRSFTLIELLVVVAIIAVLVAVLLPALATARGYAGLAVCLSNLKQIDLAILAYTDENGGFFPVPVPGKYVYSGQDCATAWPMWFYGGDDQGNWGPITCYPARERPLAPYLDPYSPVYRCPGDKNTAGNGIPYWDVLSTSYPMNLYVGPGYARTINGARLTEVQYPTLTRTVNDMAFEATRLPGEYSEVYPQNWWHPAGLQLRKTAVAFTDGHSAYIELHLYPPLENCATYRTSP